MLPPLPVSTLDQTYKYLERALHPGPRPQDGWWYDMRAKMQQGKYEGHTETEKFKRENPAFVTKQSDWVDWDLHR